MQHPNRSAPEVVGGKNLCVTQLATPPTPIDTGAFQWRRGNKSSGKTGRQVVALGAGYDLSRAFKARLRAQDPDLTMDAARPGRPENNLGTKHELGALALTLVEVEEAVGKGPWQPGYHRVLRSLCEGNCP